MSSAVCFAGFCRASGTNGVGENASYFPISDTEWKDTHPVFVVRRSIELHLQRADGSMLGSRPGLVAIPP